MPVIRRRSTRSSPTCCPTSDPPVERVLTLLHDESIGSRRWPGSPPARCGRCGIPGAWWSRASAPVRRGRSACRSGAVGLVGAGMLGVAAVVGGAMRGGGEPDEPRTPPLRPGTVQAHLVATLQGYRKDLEQLQQRSFAPAVGGVRGAGRRRGARRGTHREPGRPRGRRGRRRRRPGRRTSRAADAAIGRGPRLRRRMLERRRDLLAKLTAAVDEVGELYAKLLELSTTAQLAWGRHRRVERGCAGERLPRRDPRRVRRARGRRVQHPRAAVNPGRSPIRTQHRSAGVEIGCGDERESRGQRPIRATGKSAPHRSTQPPARRGRDPGQSRRHQRQPHGLRLPGGATVLRAGSDGPAPAPTNGARHGICWGGGGVRPPGD